MIVENQTTGEATSEPAECSWRSDVLSTLPLGLRGSAPTIEYSRGFLYRASRSRHHAASSSDVGGSCASRGAITARGASPYFVSGTPISATSPTLGCAASTSSTSAQ